MPLHQLPSVTIAAGGVANISLKDLPVFLRGRIPHVRAFLFEVDVTPTFTTAPTTVGINNVVKNLDFWDGRMSRFSGGFNAMRVFERLHNGALRLPDADTNPASAAARYFRRVLHVGPPNMAGGLGDFMLPTGMLKNAELRIEMGALTDISADTTAVTGTIRIFAVLELMDELRIPPAYQFQRFTAGSPDYPLPGRALYECIALLNSASFDAIAAGDFNSFRVDLGAGDVVGSIPAEALTAAFQDDWARGDFSNVNGEPRGTNDDNAKVVDHATPAAIAAAPADIQPVLWTRPGHKLTKLELAETSARVQWDGSQSTAVILAGRILPQPQAVAGGIAADALSAIGRNPGAIKFKTVSKVPYDGPLKEFMPLSVKVA